VSVVLREEAAAVDAPFVDVSDLFADGRGIGEDGVHPTDAGHRRIAEFLGPRLADVL
jgi:lysophospholipase L1-like esterase